MLRHVAGIAEIVEDVEQALAFYRDVVGLKVEHQDNPDYAMLAVPGVLHFGIWSRAAAAESVFGSREYADRIPLGFTVEFEVDDIQQTSNHIQQSLHAVDQAPRKEPWGQSTCRMMSPGHSLIGFSETPWARELSQNVAVQS